MDEKKENRGLDALIPERSEDNELTGEEMRALLKALDILLGKLSQEDVEAFSKTKEFELYERLMDKHKK